VFPWLVSLLTMYACCILRRWAVESLLHSFHVMKGLILMKGYAELLWNDQSITLHWHTKGVYLSYALRLIQFASSFHKNPSKILGSPSIYLSKPDEWTDMTTVGFQGGVWVIQQWCIKPETTQVIRQSTGKTIISCEFLLCNWFGVTSWFSEIAEAQG